jgi:NDP-sugar pyrophosphorylase family protein
MNQPTLLIMAAGMGSRYGSLKQLDAFGPGGETLIEYSIFDAIRAGFGKVIFIIRKSLEKDFDEVYFSKLSGKIPIDYVCQETDILPEGVTISGNRTKPWGTGQAVWVASSKIKEPFAVINGDDFYGKQAFQLIAASLRQVPSKNPPEYYLIGYKLAQTLSEHGFVSRGICEVDENNYLRKITEQTHILGSKNGIIYKTAEGQEVPLTGNEIASMNLMGFTPVIFKYIEQQFVNFLSNNSHDNKTEFYLPKIVNRLVETNQAQVKVQLCSENWFGVTYPEDKPIVKQKLSSLVNRGVYPQNLWE